MLEFEKSNLYNYMIMMHSLTIRVFSDWFYVVLLLFQGGFAKCFELTDLESKEIFAGKIVSKSLLVKQHQKDKVGQRTFFWYCLNHTFL